MKKAMVFILLTFALTLGATAYAEHGDWGVVGGGEGLILMDAYPVADETIIFMGMNQSSEFGMDFIYKSVNSGTSLTTMLGTTVDGSNPCEMLALFEMGVGADFPDENFGLMMGLGFPEDCIEDCDGMTMGEAFLHMMVCMLQVGTKITTTSDGGDTWDSAMLPDSSGKTLDRVDMVDAYTGYASGYPSLLMKTIDGGTTWTDLPKPGTAQTLSVNYLEFKNASTGYLAAGDYPDEYDKGASNPFDHYVKRWTDLLYPAYRFEFGGQSKGDDKFGVSGAVYKTADGGQTWETLFESNTEAVSGVSFFDNLHGIMFTDRENSSLHALNTIYATEDGGATWVEASMPGPLPDLPQFGTGNYFISELKMVGKKLAYAVGAADRAGGAAFSVIFVSEDGGMTWTEDTDYNYAGAARTGTGLLGMGWLNGQRAWTVGTYFERGMYLAENFAPHADAGVDLDATHGTIVALDGSGSYDDNGDQLTYNWVKLSGPDIAPFNNTAEIANFIPEQSGTYVFELTVDDGELSDSDEVTIEVTSTSGGDDDDDADDDDSGDDDDTDDDDDEDEAGCCG